MTDRYTKAIEQLGSDKLDVRIGGVYALERIARDSARDHPTVMEVLAAFIREHSRDSGHCLSPAPTCRNGRRADVQAAVTVIGRRDSRARPRADRPYPRRHPRRGNSGKQTWRARPFTKLDLTGAVLLDAAVARAVFYEADLTRSILDRRESDRAQI